MSTSDSTLQDLELALQLQLEDLEELRMGGKGKAREGETDDLNLAIQLYKAELASSTFVASDQSMCGSIARAVESDADLLWTIAREEVQAALDRDLATRLSTESPPTTPARPASAASSQDAALLASLAALMFPEEDEHPAESSASAARRPAPQALDNDENPMIECISCRDEHQDLDISRCPCSHAYCDECLQTLFRASLSDESLFPPRCCGQPITLDSCRPHLPSELADEFLAKKVEMETPNRTYCHEPTCSTFIPQSIDGEVATCSRCQATTCAACKRAAHEGDCPHDPAAQELARVATENGWQQCYACHRFVELDYGCNHMTCRCGAEFCYVCGLLWKTCACAQWDEERLLARAQAIADRDGLRFDNAAGRADRVDRERVNLVENHECDHLDWRSRRGPHGCEGCGDVLPVFIYECAQCRIMACRRCRFNRF